MPELENKKRQPSVAGVGLAQSKSKYEFVLGFCGGAAAWVQRHPALNAAWQLDAA